MVQKNIISTAVAEFRLGSLELFLIIKVEIEGFVDFFELVKGEDRCFSGIIKRALRSVLVLQIV